MLNNVCLYEVVSAHGQFILTTCIAAPVIRRSYEVRQFVSS